jgi:hypothetical protein
MRGGARPNSGPRKRIVERVWFGLTAEQSAWLDRFDERRSVVFLRWLEEKMREEVDGD